MDLSINLKTLSRFISTILLSATVCGISPPPPPVHSPEEQLFSFKIAEAGYRIELVASDPMIQDPVAITFDGEGRLWVVEMRGYMQDIDRSRVNDPIGRISVLEDTNRDGIMDKGTVFLDNLVLPRTVAVHPDGVLFAESKPLWFAKDMDGDLIADQKTLVDPDYAKDSIEHSANGLYRALDNWIYNAKEGHRYRRQGEKWIRQATEPRGQWGICQDDQGRLFYNYNHSQLHADLVPPNTLTRNPNHEPSTGISVGVTATNAVFPIRPNTASNRGYIPGALDDLNRIKEFTSAGAPFIYRGDLFPEFSGNAFVCETVGNLVKRNVITNAGARISGTPAYPDRDFLASTDERFRPCWITTGPDGALYIADMYRGIVQDGPHMSPYLREHSVAREMEKPIHLGRIWRIVPEDFKQPTPPRFSEMSAADLVGYLSHPSGWWRDQAQMHLIERQIVSAIPALRQMTRGNGETVSRLHALWTLEGLGDPQPEKLTDILHAESPVLKAAGLRVLFSLGLPHDQLLDHLERLAVKPLPEELRLQMILTLGDLTIDDRDRFMIMQKLIASQMHDPLMRDATLSSLTGREADFLRSLWPTLANRESAQNVDSGYAFLIESLCQAIVKSRDPDAVSKMLSMVEASHPNWIQKATLAGIEIHAADLSRTPIKLTDEPVAARYHKSFYQFFSWPGHTPTYSPTKDIRQLSASEQSLFARGRQIYLSSCVACHGNDGKGMKLLAPPLAGSDWVEGDEKRLVRVLFHGLSGPITVSGKRYTTPEVQPVMPPLATLGNNEIAAVLTYIRREWGNTADPITPGAINRHRIESQGRTLPWTEEELEPFKHSQ